MMERMILLIALFVSAAAAAEINWAKDYQEAVKKATKTHKPILFVFSSHGCKWCVHLERTTFRDIDVIERLNSGFISVIAYTDAGDYVPRELWRPGTPAIWFLDSQGTPLFEPLMGAVDAENFIKASSIVQDEFQKREKMKMYSNRPR
jgi:thioredoxin-related protein